MPAAEPTNSPHADERANVRSARKRERRPDGSLEQTLTQVTTNQDFKRMLVFGLRTLSQMCAVSNRQYADNVYFSIDQGFISVLANVTEKHKDDSEVISLVVKIIQGVTRAFVQEPDETLRLRAIEDGIAPFCGTLLNCAISTVLSSAAPVWESCLAIVEDGNKSGVLTFDSQIIDSIVSALQGDKVDVALARPCFKIVSLLAAGPNRDKLVTSRAPTHVLSACDRILAKTANVGTEVTDTIIDGLAACESVVNPASGKGEPYNDDAALHSLISILQRTTGKRSVKETAARLLAAFLGTELLTKTLQKIEEGGDSAVKGMAVLNALSYVSSFSQQFLDSGRLPPLCRVVINCIKSLDPKDATTLNGLKGACSMLASVTSLDGSAAENPDFLATIDPLLNLVSMLDASKVEHLTGVMKVISNAAMKSPDVADKAQKSVLIDRAAACFTQNRASGLNAEACRAAIRLAAITSKFDLPSRKLWVTQGADLKLVKQLQSLSVQHPDPELCLHACTFLSQLVSVPEVDVSKWLNGVVSLMASLTSADRDAAEGLVKVLTAIYEKAKKEKSLADTMAKAGVSAGVLQLTLTFSDNPTIVKACRALLDQSASEEDLAGAVAALQKGGSSPKANKAEVFSAIATLNGLGGIDRLAEGLSKVNVIEVLLKTIGHVTQSSPFDGQSELISGALSCLVTLSKKLNGDAGVIGQQLMTLANSPNVKILLEKQNENDRNPLLALLEAATSICAEDNFTNVASLSKLVDTAASTMRKYPEQRKAQDCCLLLISTLLGSRTFDCKSEFLRGGTAKQLLTFMQKASALEGIQRSGLQIILVCCLSSTENRDAMRNAGAMDAVKASSRSHQNKPDIQKLVIQCSNLLMPEEQARAEVTEQINNLNIASKNRDLLTGQDALRALAGLTAAADAAKHASKNQVGDAMKLFFESMNSPKVPFPEMEVCSTEAVRTVKNVGAVGKPHSTLLLKSGALDLLKTIVQDARKSPNHEGVSLMCLEAGRSLLSHERQPHLAPGAAEFSSFLQSLLPELQNDPAQLMPVVATMGLLATAETVNNPMFTKSIAAMIPALENAKNGNERVDCLRCIYQMFNASGDKDVVAKLVQLFTEAGGCECLLKTLDAYGPDEIQTAVWCRKALEKITCASGDATVLQQSMLKRGGAQAITSACKAFGRNLGMCRNDADASTVAVTMLTAFTSKMDRTTLYETGILDIVQDVMEAHPNNQELHSAVGELLVNFGAEEWLEKYFKTVVEMLSKKPSGYEKSLLEALKKLEVFVPCQTDQVDRAFKHSIEAQRLMALNLEKFRSNNQMLPSMTLVNLRLVQRFADDPLSPYGATSTVESGMMKALCELMANKDPSSQIRKDRPFLRDAFQTLDLLCLNESSWPALAEYVGQSGFLVSAWEILQRYQKDPEVAAPVIQFLGHFAQTEETAELLEKSFESASVRDLGDDASSSIFNVVWNLRRSGVAVEAGLEAVGAVIARQRKGKGVTLCKKSEVAKIKQLVEASAEGVAGYAVFTKEILLSKNADDCGFLVDDALQLIIAKWLKIRDSDAETDDSKNKILRCLGSLSAAYAERAKFTAIKSSNAIGILSDAVKTRFECKAAVKEIAHAFQSMTPCEELRDQLLTKGIPALVSEGFQTLATDPTAAEDVLSMILTLIENDEPNCNFVRGVNGVRETLAAVESLAMEQSPEAQERLLHLVREIRRLLDEAPSSVLTLEEVHRKWSNRKENNGETLSLAESPVLIDEFNFVATTTQEYSREPLADVNDPLGREFSFGCLCFGLVHEVATNIPLSIEKECHKFFLQAAAKQTDEEMVQYIVEGNLGCVLLAAADWSSLPDAANISVSVVARGHAWKGLDLARKEAFLIKRLQFMERMCHVRPFYNETSALKTLSSIWDEVDQSQYSMDVLKGVVRCLRVMVNEGIADEVVELKLPQRLLERVENPDSSHDLLADVLFCIGTLASLVRIKSLFGELGGIEKIVDLLKRCEKQQKKSVDTSRTQQNACLALGNLVLGHGKNSNAFGNAGGIDLAIRVMKSSMTGKVDYDLANAASILMCNVSFKRDDFKEALGNKGAPQAIILTVHNYDGIATESAYRCLTSMFKAIANLALLPANVSRFLESNIAASLQAFYQHSEALPDQLILDSLRTLSNLTLENSTAFMTQFGTLLSSLVHLLVATQRSDPAMLAFLFETFASLCRIPENREQFIADKGIEIVLQYLNSIKNESVYEMGLQLLGVLTATPKAADQMVTSGIFPFLLSLLDDCDELNSDLICAGLKVIRRLVRTKAGAVAFVETGPMALLTDVLCAAAAQANSDCPSASTATECLRIILQLLNLHPPTFGAEIDLKAEVVSAPKWHRELSVSSTKSKSFSRIFSRSSVQSEGSNTTDSEADCTTSGDDASSSSSPPVEEEGSPVALDSPHDLPISNGTALCKPKGPRSYENIGLDARRNVAVSRALFHMLMEQDTETLKLDRLTEFSLILLAYMATEKVDGLAMAFTECDGTGLGEFVYRVYGQTSEKNGEIKKRLIFEGSELLGNLCALLTSEDLEQLADDTKAIDSIRTCAAQLNAKKEGSLKSKVEELWALLSSPGSELKPQIFYPLATYDFPLNKADFGAEQYPNGVQDLVGKIRQKIRKGGKCQCVALNEDAEASVRPCFWKSSTDMLLFEYMHDNRQENYDFKIPFSRVRKIERGIHSTALLRKHAAELKLRPYSTVTLVVGPCAVHPTGTELSLLFPTRFHAKRFFNRAREWQAAATE